MDKALCSCGMESEWPVRAKSAEDALEAVSNELDEHSKALLQADVEIAELEEENERLSGAWMVMQRRERETDREIDNLREEANELVGALRAEVAELEKAQSDIREIYAGMEGFEAETAPEAYCLRIIEQMYKATLQEGE